MANQFELPFVFEPPDDEINWEDEDIEGLRKYVLKKTLSSLRSGKGSLKTRTECLEWLMDDSVTPFSYVVCCDAMDLDPYTLRDMTIDTLRRRCSKGLSAPSF